MKEGRFNIYLTLLSVNKAHIELWSLAVIHINLSLSHPEYAILWNIIATVYIFEISTINNHLPLIHLNKLIWWKRKILQIWIYYL